MVHTNVCLFVDASNPDLMTITYDAWGPWLKRLINEVYDENVPISGTVSRQPARLACFIAFNENRIRNLAIVKQQLIDWGEKVNDPAYRALFAQVAPAPVLPPPEPEPVPVIVDGIEIISNQNYNVNIFNSSGQLISSGLISGQKIIDLQGTNVTVKIISAEEVAPPELIEVERLVWTGRFDSNGIKIFEIVTTTIIKPDEPALSEIQSIEVLL